MKHAAVVSIAMFVAFASQTSLADEAQQPDPTEAEPAPDPEPEPEPVTEETPWSKGVPQAKRDRAQALLEEGNQLFLEKQFPDALNKYKKAVAEWDHPAIRFNLVRTYINLDRPLEAYNNLEKALRFGAAPLQDSVYAEALNYQKLLRGQIADLSVSCEQSGATVSLDGEPFLSCPGKKSVRVEPGTHQLVGEKSGYLTRTETVTALPGEPYQVAVELVPLADATVTKRRWATWKPWAVVGGGAAVVGLGVLLRLSAQSQMDQYGDDLADLCGTGGCQPGDIPSSVADQESRAELTNVFAISTIVVGGAAILGGGALVFMNRPQTYEKQQQQGPAVRAMVSGDTVGLTVGGRF